MNNKCRIYNIKQQNKFWIKYQEHYYNNMILYFMQMIQIYHYHKNNYSYKNYQ